jgi:three-Cys-motif partner protein
VYPDQKPMGFHAELFEAPSDRLITPEVGSWAEDKYRLLRTYASLFATSMKAKWDVRVYIDLFAGPGKVRIEGTTRVVNSSPLIVLEIPDPFDRYIFCEENNRLLVALEDRVKALHPSKDVHFLQGDANQLTGRILGAMPPYGPRKRVLAFCFADPFKLRNLQFPAIRALAKRYMDFLILLPTGMDANRNWKRYVTPAETTVDLFLGTPEWRDEWKRAATKGTGVDVFLMDFYWQQMKKLGYRYGGVEDSVLVRSTEKHLPLYHLGFFSRHSLGQKFWNETRKYSQDQRPLFDR